MKKLLLIFCALLGTVGAWAQVTSITDGGTYNIQFNKNSWYFSATLKTTQSNPGSFRFDEVSTGVYNIYSVEEGKYITRGDSPANGGTPSLSETLEDTNNFKWIAAYDGNVWRIKTLDETFCLNGWTNTLSESNDVKFYSDAAHDLTPLKLWKVPTAEQKAAKAKADAWTSLITSTSTGLMSNTNQWVSAAADASEGWLDRLTDGNLTNYFHSDWHGSYSGVHYIEATLPEATNSLLLYYYTRSTGTGCPTNITVSASTDGETWVDDLATINESDMPKVASTAYLSKGLTFDASYSHFRFYVHSTNSGTNSWFCLAEANLFAATATTSEAMTLAHIPAADLTAVQIARIDALDTDLRSTTITVTYNLYESDGTTFVSSEEVVQEKNSDVNIPSSINGKTYYDYATEGTIGAVDCDIKVIRTLKEGYVISLDGFSNSKCYNIRNNRGTWAVGSGATDINSTFELDLAFSASDTKQQFAFITYEGNVYLYSVGENKFAYVDGNKLSLTSAVTSAVAASPVTLQLSTNGTYMNSEPVVVTIGGNMFGVSTGFSPDIYKYNSLGDGGNCAYIKEAGSFDATDALAALEEYFHPAYTVTYVVKDEGGNTIFTSDPVGTELGAKITTLPTEYQRAFCSYNTVDVTISDVNTNVEFTATYNLPFTLSPSYAEATWYNVTLRSTKSASKGASEPYALAAATISDKAEDAYRWAFAGNPYALVVYNKASESTYTLTKDGNNAVMREGNYTWTLCQNSDGFTLKVTGSDYTYVNDNNSTLGFWNNAAAATDNGSTFRVEAVVDNYYNLVKANVLPYIFDNPNDIVGSNPAASIDNLFGISTSAAEAIVTTYGSQLASQSFNVSEYSGIVAAKDEGIIYPTSGKYYLLKNNFNGKYMRVTAGDTRGAVVADLSAEEAAKDASAHIYIVEIDSKPYMMSQGQYFNWVNNNDGNKAYTKSGNKDKYAHFVSAAPGVGAFSLALGNGEGDYASYLNPGFYALYNEETKEIGGSSNGAASDKAQWTFEEVSSITISLNTVGERSYATFSAPFDVTIGEGAEAYTVLLDGDRAAYSKIDSKQVPAGAGVLLISETAATSVTATISAPAFSELSNNSLTGYYFAKTLESTQLVLGNGSEGIGFYQMSGTAKANKAYMVCPSSVKGFRLVAGDDIETAINAVESASKGQMFDLSGRRVNAAVKGLYITNGKKVLVK